MKPRFLPDDLEEEILLRIPVKSIHRFKSVCKRWHSLTGKPSFIIRYNHLSDSRGKLFCFGKDPITKPRVVISTILDHQPIEIIEDLELPPFIDNGWVFEGADIDLLLECGEEEDDRLFTDIHIVGPVNGIYCIFHKLREPGGGTLILWNPATRSYKHILPLISFPFPLHLNYRFTQENYPEVCNPIGLHFGFGYDDNINDYKVVVICHWDMVYNYPPDERWHVRVYNNATDSWTNICCVEYWGSRCPAFPYIVSEPEFCNSFINGTCHWSCAKREGKSQCSDDVSEYAVLAFDMADHSFKVMCGPPIPPDRYSTKPSVWVLRETISVVATSAKMESVEVWIMKEYGVEDSWNLLWSIAIETLDVGFGVVGIPSGEWIFFGDNNGQLISYRFDDDEVVEHGVRIKPHDSYHGTLGVFNYVENLSPIKPTNHQQQ